MIESRKLVPNYYESSRDFQVFLKLVDIVVNVCQCDTEYFVSLLSPENCKARLLPLLANHVGYEYDYQEKVSMNRTIIKNWAVLKRNRGSVTGISMAVALALKQIEDIDQASIFNLFNINYETYTDAQGRNRSKIQIYLHQPQYLSKLHDLIEAVRPAGMPIEIIPAVGFESSETVVLTDKYAMMGYDYVTGKILKIGDINIEVENCWEIMKAGVSMGEYLVDDKFYDTHHNYTEKRINASQQILYKDEPTGEVIRAPYIYETQDYDGRDIPSYLRFTDEHGNQKMLVKTDKYFNLNKGSRILNTCYEIRKGGKSSGFFVTGDWYITNNTKTNITFKLEDEILNGRLVKRVYRISKKIKYNWYIDLESGFFVQDTNGSNVNRTQDEVPWDSASYITKRRYIMNETANGIIYPTSYFATENEDIQDLAGNVILSVKDRYAISDSASVGFSEVHDQEKGTDYNKTFRRSRDYVPEWDRDFFTKYIQKDYNDYSADSSYTDTRISLHVEDFEISDIWREYDTTSNVGTLKPDIEVHTRELQIPIDKLASDIQTSESTLRIIRELRSQDGISDIFESLSFYFDNENVSKEKTVFMRWKARPGAEQFYNLYALPEVIPFSRKGEIRKKKIRFSAGTVINIPNTTYDNSTRIDINDDAFQNQEGDK